MVLSLKISFCERVGMKDARPGRTINLFRGFPGSTPKDAQRKRKTVRTANEKTVPVG